MSNKKKTQADIDWENRTLCVDESCIGIIGPDGRCKECGKTYEGFQHATTDAVEKDVPDERDIGVQDQAETVFDTDWENRTLCVDESCIGVIGADGRCKECGRPYEETGHQ